MRWQQLLSLSLVTAIGLVGCARQARQSNLDIEKKQNFNNVAFNPENEKSSSFALQPVSEAEGVRGILDGSAGLYQSTDQRLIQLTNYLQRAGYAQILEGNVGITASNANYYTAFNNLSAQCYFNPWACGNYPGVQSAALAVITFSSSQAAHYRLDISTSSYAYDQSPIYSSFGGRATVLEWSRGADGKSTVAKILLPSGGEVVTLYSAISKPQSGLAVNLNVSVSVTPWNGSLTPSGAAATGTRDVSNVLANGGWNYGGVGINSVDVNGNGTTPATRFDVKGMRLTQYQFCSSWACLWGQ